MIMVAFNGEIIFDLKVVRELEFRTDLAYLANAIDRNTIEIGAALDAQKGQVWREIEAYILDQDYQLGCNELHSEAEITSVEHDSRRFGEQRRPVRRRS